MIELLQASVSSLFIYWIVIYLFEWQKKRARESRKREQEIPSASFPSWARLVPETRNPKTDSNPSFPTENVGIPSEV